jgi:hypothetical protein
VNTSGGLVRHTLKTVTDFSAVKVVGLIGLVLAVVVLSGCRVDLATSVSVAENGSGTISVVITADADAVRNAPELATSLNVDDLRAAGWTVDVQSPAVNGGLTVVVARAFATVDEASLFLSQLSGDNGPLRNITLTRTGGVNDASYQFSGVGGLPTGLAGFADADVLTKLGGAPFAAALAERGGVIDDVLGISLALTLPGKPGEIGETTATLTPRQADDASTTFTWNLALDASDSTLTAFTRDRDISAMVAWYVARGLLVCMILLVAAAMAYIATVVYRRSRSTPAS